MDWLRVEEAPDGVRVVRMHHGEQNRISGPFCAAIRSLLADLAGDDGARAVVLTGHGRFFCNGLDLVWARDRSRVEVVTFLDEISGLIRDTVLYPKPIVGAINGHAFGMGAIWASGFDVRVVRADRGWICFPMFEYDLPLTPGMIAYCEHGLGTTTFREMAWTGRRYTGPLAVSTGWAHAVVEDADLLEVAAAHAASLGAKGSMAFSATKQAWARPVVEIIDTLDSAANRAYPLVPVG